MSLEDRFDCNAKRLIGAIKSLLDLSSYNQAMYVMSREKPGEFVQFVEEHLTDIQAEFERNFKPMNSVFPRFIKQNAMAMTAGGYMSPNKIGFIQMVRRVAGMGLHDSKKFTESMPTDFRMFYFNSVDEANDSNFAKQCRSLNVEVEWVNVGSTGGLVHYSDYALKVP